MNDDADTQTVLWVIGSGAAALVVFMILISLVPIEQGPPCPYHVEQTGWRLDDRPHAQGGRGEYIPTYKLVCDTPPNATSTIPQIWGGIRNEPNPYLKRP